MKMVTDQKHSSDSALSEQEVIRCTEKLAKLLGLDEQKLRSLWNCLQNTKVNSVFSNDDYLNNVIDELLAIGQCNCNKKFINISSESNSSESSNSDINEIVNIINCKRVQKKIRKRQAQRRN